MKIFFLAASRRAWKDFAEKKFSRRYVFCHRMNSLSVIGDRPMRFGIQ